MDLDQINHLTDEQKERYMKLMRLFDMPGWEIVHKWADVNAEEAKERAAMATSWEENRIYAGQRIVYDILRQLRDINEQEYEALARQNAETKAETEEVDEAEFE